MKIPFFLGLMLWSGAVGAEVIGKDIPYKDGSVSLEGYLAVDSSKAGARPGVLIIPDWMGVSPFYQEKARDLARLGYIAFVADVYGQNVRPQNTEEASRLAGTYKADRPRLRARGRAAFQTLLKNSQVDPRAVAAIGYCFGGTAALELARDGAPLAGVVSFHGGLATPTPNDARMIRGRVLVLHGADDPYVPDKEVSDFESEMKAAQVDYQLVKYSGAVHAFTNPAAGNDPSKGAAYNKKASERSWIAMRSFFEEIFSPAP